MRHARRHQKFGSSSCKEHSSIARRAARNWNQACFYPPAIIKQSPLLRRWAELISPWPWARFGHFSDFRRKRAKTVAQKFLILWKNFGAGDRDRTGDVQLGKLAFYR